LISHSEIVGGLSHYEMVDWNPICNLETRLQMG